MTIAICFIYFLKTKDETLEKTFKEFKNLIENQQNRKIMVLIAGDNCSRDFENYLNEADIIHQRTNSHIPEQNGIWQNVFD